MTLLCEPPADEAISFLRGLDPAQAEFGIGTVYLLHLVRPYVARSGKCVQQFQHYIGHAEPGVLARRMAEHGTGSGARCLQVAHEAGIDWLLARTWPGGYDRERRIKAFGGARRICPLCGVLPRIAHRPTSAPTAGRTP